MDAPTNPALLLDLLGVPHWHAEAGVREPLSAQDAALFALLALDGPQGRDVLAGRIWPEATQQQAANNLRKHVSRLRRDTGHALFHTGATLSLVSGLRVDVLAVAELASDRLLDAEFLAGCDFADNDFLQRWVDERRASVRQLRADALAEQADLLEKRHELAAAIRLAERIVELAPLHEHAWRRLMRLHYLRADHTAAIAAFERFELLLREETGARPGPETLRLLTTIERGAQVRALPHKVVPVSLVRPPVRIGRHEEWLAMGRAWSAERAFLLVGEAGIGKSRLLGDFAQGRPGVVSERARAGDAQTPYEVLARVLRHVLSASKPELDAFTRNELARLLPDIGPAPQMPGQESSLRRAAETVFAAAARNGLAALFVDDLQFADLATLETLRWLSASPSLSALRFGFAARPLDDDPAGALLRSWLGDSNRPEAIELRPMAAGEVAELLSSLELPELEAPGLAARLFTHAGGHPLFTLEALKDGWLHRRDLRAEALPNPQTVQTLLERRLRELPSEAIDLVRVAAVAGADLSPERAAALLGSTPLALVGTWSLLERANVLHGMQFSHDLMRESALALVPQPLRRALHALVAEQLASDATVPPGRVADHWQAAERWAEAGAWWHRAGIAARLAGRLQEQQTLLERAAACFRHADEGEKEFEAVRASFDSVLLRHGGAAVLAGLPRLEALAVQPEAVLHCRLIQAEALLDLERSAEAMDVATAAVQLAGDRPLLLGDALCLQGMALAQQGRAEEAVVAARHAADAAHAAGLPAQELRAVRSLAYVLYMNGRIGEALPAQLRALGLAELLNDEAETAAAEASAAAMHATIGDVAATLERARRAHRRYCAMGLAQNSTLGSANLVVLGRAAAYMGLFDEASDALHAAKRMAGEDAQTAIHARSRIALATLQLTLGNPAAARTLVEALPAATPPGMRMQAALVLAQAEQIEGGSGAEHLQRIGRIGAEHPDLPIVMSAWIEWSYQGDAARVVAELERVRQRFETVGRSGTARSLLLRQVARMNELGDAAARKSAARHAKALLPHIGVGTCAATYPPEGWRILAAAFERDGDAGSARRCRAAARAWIDERALPHIAAQARQQFLTVNPVNKSLCSGGG